MKQLKGLPIILSCSHYSSHLLFISTNFIKAAKSSGCQKYYSTGLFAYKEQWCGFLTIYVSAELWVGFWGKKWRYVDEHRCQTELGCFAESQHQRWTAVQYSFSPLYKIIMRFQHIKKMCIWYYRFSPVVCSAVRGQMKLTLSLEMPEEWECVEQCLYFCAGDPCLYIVG